MKLIIRQKKGALQLSINAIVVLILAITMLGLGLGFMRSMFGQTTAQFEDVAESMKGQVIDEIKSSNEKVILNKYEISIKKSEEKEVYYGIKETSGNERCFAVNISCETGMAADSSGSDIDISTFNEYDVKGGQVAVLKAVIKANTEAAFTTYPCELRVCANTGTNVDCPNSCASTSTLIHGQKDFFVTLG